MLWWYGLYFSLGVAIILIIVREEELEKGVLHSLKDYAFFLVVAMFLGVFCGLLAWGDKIDEFLSKGRRLFTKQPVKIEEKDND